MICNTPVKKGEKLVSVPRKLWMTSSGAQQSPICRDIILENSIESWQGLSLHLLCERLRGPDSFWAEYINLLPDQKQHLLLWSKEDHQLLKGSPMLKKLRTRLQQVQDDTEQLLKAGANGLVIPGVDDAAQLVTVDSMKWAAATLLSRAFNLEVPVGGFGGDAARGADGDADHAAFGGLGADGDAFDMVEVESERILALVPWADTLNHSSEAWDRSILTYDADADAAVLFAHTDYAAGDEVYDSYGTWLTPSELLMDYAFVDPRNTNYAIQVPAESVAAPAAPINAALLDGLARCLGGSLELSLTPADHLDDTLLCYVRCAVAPASELRRAGWTGDAPSDGNEPLDVMAALSEPTDYATEALVLETIMAWCERQTAGYASTLASDTEEVAAESTPWLSRQVLRALVSEKRSICGVQKELRSRLQMLKEGCPLDSLYT